MLSACSSRSRADFQAVLVSVKIAAVLRHNKKRRRYAARTVSARLIHRLQGGRRQIASPGARKRGLSLTFNLAAVRVKDPLTLSDHVV
jgi:hypothetical protein